MKEANTEIARGNTIQSDMHMDKFRRIGIKQLRLVLASVLSTIVLLGLTAVFGFSEVFIQN